MAEPTGLYAVFDGARDPAILPMLHTLAPHAQSLFREPVDPRLTAAGPFLTPITPGSPLAKQWRQQAWGDAWGIVCTGPADIAAVRHHLRTLLRVMLPGARGALFRFYDPRVLRAFLPTSDLITLRRFFGPMLRFYAETEDGTATVSYRLTSAGLLTE